MTEKIIKFSDAFPPIKFTSGITKIFDKTAITIPLATAKIIPSEEIISASL